MKDSETTGAPGTETAETVIRLVLTDEERVPLYLQIVNQVRYLVTSRDLAAGSQMPSVRVLAAQLGVNNGTIAQAYSILKDEGILTSQQGKGTYVVSQPDSSAGRTLRQARLKELFDKAIDSAYAMGFDRQEIRTQFNTSVQQQLRTLPVVVIAPSVISARKYADLVAETLPADALPTVTAGTIEELQQGNQRLLQAYERAHFTVVAFLSNVPTVASALQAHGIQSDLVGLTAVMSSNTVTALAALDPAESYSLFTEQRNVNAVLGLLNKHSSIDLRSLRILTELSSQEQLRDARGSKLIYTFGVSDVIEELAVASDDCLELAFTLSPESVDLLRNLPARTGVIG